jgi:hypothetical protein
MNKQKKKFGEVLLQPLPIPEPDIKSFTYRVEDIQNSLTKARVKTFRLMELKKSILKAKSMKVRTPCH